MYKIDPIVFAIRPKPSEQPLFNTQVILPGSTRFFNSVADEFTNLSNFHQGYLPYPQNFDIKRISLLAGPETNYRKLFQLLKTAVLKLHMGGFCLKLEIPAPLALWGDLKDINLILRRIKKLPIKQQEVIIRNLRISEGFLLENPLSLPPQEALSVDLITKSDFKEKMALTCMLSGTLTRSIY